MKTYKAASGDTLETISSREYGSPQYVDLIRSANPHLSAGLTEGVVLNIPDTEDIPTALPGAVAANSPSDTSITVNGQQFRFWDSMTLSLSMDSVSRFGFSAPFEPINVGFREHFRPFEFQPVTINVGGSPVFTGNIVNVVPSLEPGANMINVDGYSRAGVLQDCMMPASSFPLEYQGLDLRGVATAICKPFGLVPVFNVGPGPTIEKVAVSPQAKLWQLLTKLAQQRNQVIGDDAAGNPLFHRTTNSPPIQDLEPGVGPVTSISPNFNASRHYSHITALSPARAERQGSQHTVANSRLQGVLRPLNFRADDTFGADAAEAAAAKIGRMYGNSIGYRVALSSWFNAAGELWRPNQRVRALNERAMIYRPTEFLIRNVGLSRNKTAEVATLDLVLPGSFEGVLPEVLPWD